MATMHGQAATEYIIMFAVVVIIALIVAGILGGFPTLYGGVGERESSAYWTTATVAISKHHISTFSNNTVITFRNNNHYPIFLDRATFTGTELIIGRTLYPGENVDVSGAGMLACPYGGSRYAYNVTIHYDDLDTGSNLTVLGQRPLVGTCQD